MQPEQSRQRRVYLVNTYAGFPADPTHVWLKPWVPCKPQNIKMDQFIHDGQSFGSRTQKLLLTPGVFGARSMRRSDVDGGLFGHQDRKSTRLNSSHLGISYAVFCLK